MSERYTRIILHNSQVTSYYSEQEIAAQSRLEGEVVRYLIDVGVIHGVDVAGEARRYNDDDIALLRRVHRLYHDLGINLEGIEVILRLSAQLEALQRELMQYRNQS